MRVCIVLITSLLLISSVNVWAFDVDGFRSGMNNKDVENILTKWNFDKIVNRGDSIQAYDNQDKLTQRNFSFAFSNGKLTTYQKDFKPNMNNLIMLFDKLSRDYGKLTDSKSGVDLTIVGEVRYISFYWVNIKDSIELRYNMFEKNDQLSVVYEIYTKH